MNDERWVIVPNWDRFQHYGDRDPLWIKVYTELNSRADWLQLSVAERGLLCTIWVEYARSAGIVSAKTVQRLCNGSAREKHWRSLNDAGLIELSASKPLALTRVRERAAAPSLEKKREEKIPPNPPSDDGGLKCQQCGEPNLEPGARCKACGASPRQAGSSIRELTKPTKPSEYERAANMIRNAGWQYEPIDFLAELDKFDLDPGQRHDLEQLRLSLANGASSEDDW